MPSIIGLVAHYHEVGLKGRNRNFFESTLTRNLKRALRGTGYARVRRGFGRVSVEFKPAARIDEAVERAARVFGIAYVGTGTRVAPDLDAIGGAGLELMRSAPVESFAIRARRSYSALATTSQEINEKIGRLIQDEIGAPVNLSDPQTTLWIELFGGEALVYRDRRPGPGGLPVGVSGRMLALLSGGIDSPVAAWRMARRGAEVEMVHFHGQPYTDPSSLRQATELAEILTRFQLRTTLHLIPLADAQREIVTSAPSSLRVVLYRRAMLRIASALAEERNAHAVVTGDSLGQVASQTLENITTVDSAVPESQVLRPLIGMDKQEIIDLAEHIGTFDISTRRYQDCCVLFEPRSPATRATPGEADAAEAELDIDAMVGKALAGRETRVLELPDL
ncbi:MAG TPA: tRNA uracil 4-sulfurtransferase ThiI [Actinomycetota bacterium]|jgi:thiamine biosynthesis protein ThiI|nr:tRNA uracil 4-sulfurtransferase ThiI [Actinomycetota bacterium]